MQSPFPTCQVPGCTRQGSFKRKDGALLHLCPTHALRLILGRVNHASRLLDAALARSGRLAPLKPPEAP